MSLTHVSVGDVQQVLHAAGRSVCVLVAEGVLQDHVGGLLGGEDLVHVLRRPAGVHLAGLGGGARGTRLNSQGDGGTEPLLFVHKASETLPLNQ